MAAATGFLQMSQSSKFKEFTFKEKLNSRSSKICPGEGVREQQEVCCRCRLLQQQMAAQLYCCAKITLQQQQHTPW